MQTYKYVNKVAVGSNKKLHILLKSASLSLNDNLTLRQQNVNIERSTTPISKHDIEHEPEPVLSTCDPHNLAYLSKFYFNVTF